MTKPFYHPVTPDIIDALVLIFTRERVQTSLLEREAVSTDASDATQYHATPDVVVFPLSTTEVMALVTLANEHRIPITPRGAGSGLAGGAIPIHQGIVVSFERMNRVIELDLKNLTLTVEPGVITSEINELLAPHRLFFAGYPMSLYRSMIGGNVATNAGGGKAIKYGVTGRYVLGLEVVTPTGERLHLGGKLRKNVTGYDLKQLIIGAEGTLGLITEITLHLSPLPKASITLMALYDQLDRAVLSVSAIIQQLGIVPTAVELMDQTAMTFVCNYLQEPYPLAAAKASLLIEVDGEDATVVASHVKQIVALCQTQGAYDVWSTKEEATQERMWKLRRSIAESLKQYSPEMSLEDMVLPIASIAPFVQFVQQLQESTGILMPTYGHAGDGNLHTTLLKPPTMDSATWQRVEHDILDQLYENVHALGGKISGEHGIGIKRKQSFTDLIDPAELAMMKAIKQVLDPNNILNPGKIFDIP
jgi:glycolate oxidase